MRARLLLLLALAACGDDHSTTIKCTGSAQGMLAMGSPVIATGGGDLDGTQIAAGASTTIPTAAVTMTCASDIVPAGYVALGPAIQFGAEGTWSDRPFELKLPYKAARLPKGGKRGAVRIVAQRPNGQPYFAAVTNRVLDDKDSYKSFATIDTGLLTTYQVVAAQDAGTTEPQQFAWNAIVGVSMGGNAAMSIGLRHPDRFDVIGDLGGEPGPSMVYSLGWVKDQMFGGFCTAQSGQLGQLCPSQSTKKDQFEIEADYEHFVYQSGSGVGLTLDRSLYMQASRDLGKALSNPALYNPSNPYTPPGVDLSYVAMDPATRCANPIVLKDFYDRNFNPDGSKPVITYCDGGDSAALGLGVFDPSQPQTDPAELLLAVDLNNNGKRDAGEPVVLQAFEPYQDVGTDGKADAQEPGYDPVTNPDPDGDDYHYLRNPRGTEGNGSYDQGEPFDDVGLDGVAGTCQAGQTPPMGISACYDYGEGNGKWDMSPNVAHWYDSDLQVRLATLTDAQRRHVSLWFDGGIRDFLNASVSSNQAVAQAMASGDLPFGVYDGFGGVAPGENDNTFDFNDVNWSDLPKDGYLRYGNADATPMEIDNGDGRHVGTANQIIYRIETAFAWIDKHLPDGDRDDAFDGGVTMKGLTFTSPTTGRTSPYAMYLPPGYNDPANANKTYPVVYVLHGYGQVPDDLVTLSAVIANHMIASEPLATRIQKFIMVYPDGGCRPGDGCEQGTFFMNAPLGGPAQMETNLLDLMTYIDQHYRTRQPSMSNVEIQ